MQPEVSSEARASLLSRFSNGREAVSESKSSRKRSVLRFENLSGETGWRGILASCTLLGFITIVGLLWVEPASQTSTLATLYVLATALATLRWGRWSGAISAMLSATLFDCYFIPPSRHFGIGDGWYLIGFIGPPVIGLIMSSLALTRREKAGVNGRSESHIAALNALTQSLALETKLDPIFDALQRHVRATFHGEVTFWLPEDGILAQRPPSVETYGGKRESEAAAFVYTNEQESGYGTDHFPDSTMHFLALRAWCGVVGVVGVRAADWEKWHSDSRQQLLRSFMSQAALAVTRADLVRKAQQAEVLQEADRLQRALLNSVSHNLRTPIASIMGAMNSVLEDFELLDVLTQQSLLRTAQEEAAKLNGLVQNLLDMTRLEGGAVRVKAEPCDVYDVVGSALHQLSQTIRNRPISINIPSDLPLVPMDHVLIAQVIVNMLDNALKYSSDDAPIEVGAKTDAGQLEVRVLDRGSGILEEDLTRVFDKFFRGSVLGAPRGVGLGLSICKGFVEAHGGHMIANRREHGGTEVAFFLPLEGNRG